MRIARLLSVLLFATAAFGSLVADYGPATGAFGGGWLNDTSGQNFADRVLFAVDTNVTGFNYFTTFSTIDAPSFHIKVLADDGGVPGAYIQQFDDTYDSFGFIGNFDGRNIYQAVFTFSPIMFTGGVTYWVGASPNGDGVQLSVVGPGDGHMAQFSGASYSLMADVGDQMFQLTGDAAGVPEPASAIILGCGLGALALLRRFRRR